MDCNDQSSAADPITVPLGDSITLPAGGDAETGGWYEDCDHSAEEDIVGKAGDEYTPTKDITLYWVEPHE